MFTIVGRPASRAMRIAWVLEELDLEYQWRLAQPRSPEVLALSPLGKIPVLLEGERVLFDSVAAMQTLADREGKLTYPAGTPERGWQDAITQHIVSEIDAALWTAAKHSFVLPKDKRQPAIKDVARYEFAKAMEELAVLKGSSPFVAGEICTVPDLLLCHCAGWAMLARFTLPDGPFGAFLTSLRERPSMARAAARAEEATAAADGG